MSAYISLYPHKMKVLIHLLGIALALSLGARDVNGDATREYDDQIHYRNQEIQRLENERQDTLKILDRFKDRETRVFDLLSVLNDSIKTTEAQLDRIQGKILDTKKSIAETNKAIETLQDQIDKDKNEIRLQLKALFYLSKVKTKTSFIGVNSFRYYFRNRELLKYSTHLDLELLERYTKNLEVQQTEFKRLSEQTTQLENLSAKEAEQKSLLEFEKRQQATYLRHLQEDQSAQIKYLREIQVELEQLNDKLHELEVKKENQTRVEAFQGLYKLENSLPKPVEGILIHQFEQKQSPFYTLFRRGVLVETASNADVYSVLAGKVAWAGPFRGYQNLVILDHGKGSFSVYGNMEDVYVPVNDVIKQGEILGTVAFDELEKKNLFYFEIRYKKRAVDPLKWLKKPAWQTNSN